MRSNYCEHGNYIGTPSGPDFLCGWCEDGLSVDSDQWRGYCARIAYDVCARNQTVVLARLAQSLHDGTFDFPWKAELATILVREILNDPNLEAVVERHDQLLAACHTHDIHTDRQPLIGV